MNKFVWPCVAVFLAACGKSSVAAEQVLELAGTCNAAAQVCQAKAKDTTLSFALSNARVMRPMTVKLEWKGAAITSAFVDFNMADMDMGQNRYRLLSDGKGAWEGTAVLPVCMKGRSDWIAEVRVKGEKGESYYARIPFVVEP